MRGDVPYFRIQTSSCDLLTSEQVVVKGFVRSSGLDRVVERIRAMGSADLQRQVWSIRTAFAINRATPPVARSSQAYDVDEFRKQALQIAESIGQRLLRDARRHRHRIAWPSIRSRAFNDAYVSWTGGDLYDGAAGIALFLAHLGEMLDDTDFRSAADEAIAYVFRANLTDWRRVGIGAFNGIGGAIYTLCHLGSLWQDCELIKKAERLVEKVDRGIERDTALDLIGGLAGAILSLLTLHRLTGSEFALRVAVRAGHALRAKGDVQGSELRWVSTAFPQPLAGLGHGAAGFAWAFAALGKATGEPRFTECARHAFAYERSLFVQELSNWRDLRESSESDSGHGGVVSRSARHRARATAVPLTSR